MIVLDVESTPNANANTTPTPIPTPNSIRKAAMNCERANDLELSSLWIRRVTHSFIAPQDASQMPDDDGEYKP
ncbi:uncharacterized protein N7506_005212 [Penicillium brevicompactum]|uniref:uncharacterized protein n=1 Tax=Penicillium brevicompactum TaxID=5074 RepID=UPI0025420D9A|nr:uncharacterized protein N7506_005212 [Penicillium brevicompactum]KAJ5337190.1 hypothetical protein N7506_005212 [Penicillium brevicompactum]